MALDNIYWNPSEYEYDEPLSTFSKSYVDPWDLENYAYLQQYLCSDSNSEEESSFGGSMNGKGPPPPIPVRSRVRKTMSQPIVFDKTDGIFDYESNRIPGKRSKENEEVYGVLDFDTDSEVEETSFSETMVSTKDNSFMFLSKTRDTTNQNPIYQLRGRSSSYSYGDHKYDPNNCLNDVYCRLNDLVANSKRTTPIYDDVRHSKPHFTLGKSGHLQIDYSWSWNNLDKYIYN